MNSRHILLVRWVAGGDRVNWSTCLTPWFTQLTHGGIASPFMHSINQVSRPYGCICLPVIRYTDGDIHPTPVAQPNYRNCIFMKRENGSNTSAWFRILVNLLSRGFEPPTSVGKRVILGVVTSISRLFKI